MRGPKPAPIQLSDPERQGLEKLIKAHKTRQQIVLRARIVLAAAAGKNNKQIAQEFQVTLDTVRLWRGRWRSLQPIKLEDLLEKLAQALEKKDTVEHKHQGEQIRKLIKYW